jgi:ferredoxin-like protein FixX
MSIFDIGYSTENTFTKIAFLNFDLGIHRVRLLPPEKLIWTHYLPGKATIQCLGSECPICHSNKKIQAEHPDDYYDVHGYYPSQKRHYINVLDRTEVKICPNCGYENSKDTVNKFNSSCIKCGTIIVSAEEKVSNKIKVANLSETAASQIEAHNLSILGEDGTPVGIENYDVLFMVTQTGGGQGKRAKKSITPMPDSKSNDVVELNKEDYFDLSKTVIKLEPDEIMTIMSGVSLKDIFAGRKAATVADAVVDEKLVAEVQERVEGLFNN